MCGEAGRGYKLRMAFTPRFRLIRADDQVVLDVAVEGLVHEKAPSRGFQLILAHGVASGRIWLRHQPQQLLEYATRANGFRPPQAKPIFTAPTDVVLAVVGGDVPIPLTVAGLLEAASRLPLVTGSNDGTVKGLDAAPPRPQLSAHALLAGDPAALRAERAASRSGRRGAVTLAPPIAGGPTVVETAADEPLQIGPGEPVPGATTFKLPYRIGVRAPEATPACGTPRGRSSTTAASSSGTAASSTSGSRLDLLPPEPRDSDGRRRLRPDMVVTEELHEPQTRAAADARGRPARAHAAGPQALQAPAHCGRITTECARRGLWATDPTEAWTRHDGRCAVFAIVDHCTGEAWVDAAPRMDRFAAADLLREAISDRFGSVEAGAAAGLKLRHDGGSCFRSASTTRPRSHLGIDRSPGLPLRARDQRLRREGHPGPQGTGALDRTLRHARPAANRRPPSAATTTSTG